MLQTLVFNPDWHLLEINQVDPIVLDDFAQKGSQRVSVDVEQRPWPAL